MPGEQLHLLGEGIDEESEFRSANETGVLSYKVSAQSQTYAH